MKTLLRIDVSPRVEGSHSRNLADYFENKWKSKFEDHKIIYRDLNKTYIPHIQNNTIIGFYIDPNNYTEEIRKAVEISNELISEIKSADHVLVSSPLYNFNIPSALKAYFDHVLRVGHTFNLSEKGYEGLLKDKHVYLITTKGGIYKDTPNEKLDYQEPYLKTVFNVLGFKSINLVSLEGTALSESLVKERFIKASNEIDKINF